MRAHITHEIVIDAPPEAVWRELTELASYPTWNPFIRQLDGDLRVGARLRAVIAPPGSRAMTFRPVVRTVRPARELRWHGRLLVPGLFDGTHRFALDPLPGGRTLLAQSEVFRGVLVRPLHGALARTREGFARMNEALAARVESAAHS